MSIVRPIHRDQQLDQLRAVLETDLNNARPIHIWAYGPPGTGKTLTVRYLLEREAAPAGVTPFYVNCREQFTFLSVVDRVLDQIKPLRSPQRTKERQVRILRDVLGERRCVIALDEVDVLRESDAAELLHLLTSLPKATVIAIAPSRQTLLDLPDHVRSRLAPRQVLFPRYEPQEVAAILRPILQQGLRPDGWTPEVLDMLSDHAFGDARRAIALLRHAIQRAIESGAPRITPEHVARSNFDHVTPEVEDVLARLNAHHRLLYELVVAKGPIAAPDLQRAYCDTCGRLGHKRVSSRALNKYLALLSERKVLHRERGPGTAAWIYDIVKPS